ncbi:FAD-dependent oxidoreductase [Telmatospirillum sp. J64-1]|uniref:FAD-dependent oxidoreductase n=1 Tax=Telmatospirillum sp. J64-1 TaxID=2502183 RepID=UPI00115E4117|nr:FAD-dependent oxidoreductase [Telmatospirillum sp. J64-1]
MSHDAHETMPLWQDGKTFPELDPLREAVQTEICIIGAGIAGLTTAYLLARAGRQVLVLDRGGVGCGETGRSTAHIASAVDDHYAELSNLLGAEAARLVAASHGAAIDMIERIQAEEGIDCAFQRLDGWLYPGEGGTEQEMRDEVKAARAAGLADAELRDHAPVAGLGKGPAIRFPNQAQFDPYRYVLGLAEAVRRHGGRIHTGSPVHGVSDGDTVRVSVGKSLQVTAQAAVVATCTPINDRITLHSKQSPDRTYVIAAPVAAGSVPFGLYWDNDEPYHYVRLHRMEDGTEVLIVGGEDHRTGRPAEGEQRWKRLEDWARKRFPTMGEVRWRWSGHIIEPADGIAFAGRNPGERNVYVATGDSGNGITHGTIAGMIISDLIQGRDNPWAALYDPSRVTMKAAAEYASDNLQVAEHYARWLGGGDVESTTDIAPGQGAIIAHGLSHLAVYRDELGHLHKRSAVCSHMKCLVRWNDAEKSWDCPCHGSRFDRYGNVVNGPATRSLASPED